MKCAVLFSGGLDSRIAVKLMQERGFEITALHFILPFGCGDLKKEIGKFCKENNVKVKFFDCTRGNLLKEYLGIIKKGKHGRGAGFNPCRDCKIFIFKHAKKFADRKKINVIATGEVSGQRPMSQTEKAMKIIDREIGFNLVRPLIEMKVGGRRRNKQISLAKKFGIKYPSPAGGCLLCEKDLKKRFKVLLRGNLINEKTLELVNIGRHFFIRNCWFVVGRNEKENKVIEKSENCIKSGKGKPAVYFCKIKGKKFANELQEDYKKGGR
jgi:tRNA-specific 2-thiouridylase